MGQKATTSLEASLIWRQTHREKGARKTSSKQISQESGKTREQQAEPRRTSLGPQRDFPIQGVRNSTKQTGHIGKKEKQMMTDTMTPQANARTTPALTASFCDKVFTVAPIRLLQKVEQVGRLSSLASCKAK